MSQKLQTTNLIQFLLEDFQTLLEELFGRKQQPLVPIDLPPIDILETDDFLVVKADLPGVDCGELQVSLLRNHLVIEGVKQEPPLAGGVNFLCMERSFGPFQRIVALGKAVDPQNISAVYHNGCLTVRLRKMADRRGKPIRIPVKVSLIPEDTKKESK